MPFEPGKSGNPAGCPKGAHHIGRPSDEFRRRCQEALEEAKGVEFARDVLMGKEFPQLATGEGEVLPLPPSLKDRQKALEFLTDRGYGKSEQPLTGPDGSDLAALPSSAITAIVNALSGGAPIGPEEGTGTPS